MLYCRYHNYLRSSKIIIAPMLSIFSQQIRPFGHPRLDCSTVSGPFDDSTASWTFLTTTERQNFLRLPGGIWCGFCDFVDFVRISSLLLFFCFMVGEPYSTTLL